MTNERIAAIRLLEGRQVSVALTDGSRIDDGQLVSAVFHRTADLWLFSNGADRFVPVADVVDVWEVLPLGGSRAA